MTGRTRGTPGPSIVRAAETAQSRHSALQVIEAQQVVGEHGIDNARTAHG